MGLLSARGNILIAIMISISLVALDSTIVATSIPSIVDDLGGFSDFPWLFTAYLLTQAITVPLYGKLADQFGRKPLLIFGILVFSLGSLCCAASQTMVMLIVGRAIQGMGAGAIQPMSVTIVGDVFTVHERGRIQGYIASVWAVCAVAGPTLGGVISQYSSWRWIFLINIPLCALALFMIIRFFDESVKRVPHQIDYIGSALLALFCGAIMFALLQGGKTWQWLSLPSVSLLSFGLVCVMALCFVESRASEPVVPGWLLRNRLLVTTCLASACVGAILLGLTSYLPTFMQEALGASPLMAGLALASLTVGWPISSSQSSRIYLRFGFTRCAQIGTTLVVFGTVPLLALGKHSNLAEIAVLSFVIGLGMGLTASPTMIAAQASVGWDRRGVATATNVFSRSIGSTLGVAIFSAIAAQGLIRAADEARTPSSSGITQASHHVFVGVVVAAALLVVVVAFMPKSRHTVPAAEYEAEPDPELPIQREQAKS